MHQPRHYLWRCYMQSENRFYLFGKQTKPERKIQKILNVVNRWSLDFQAQRHHSEPTKQLGVGEVRRRSRECPALDAALPHQRIFSVNFAGESKADLDESQPSPTELLSNLKILFFISLALCLSVSLSLSLSLVVNSAEFVILGFC